jgi:hypothetical protein
LATMKSFPASRARYALHSPNRVPLFRRGNHAKLDLRMSNPNKSRSNWTGSETD